MRIGIEGRTLQGRRYGVARYTHNLLREFARIEPENEYVVYLSGPIEIDGLESPSIRLRVIGGDRLPLVWRHLRLPFEMRKDRIDLHFSPSYFLPLIEVCPSVIVVHDISFKAHPEWFSRDLRMKFDDLFWPKVRNARKIITVSQYSKSEIVRLLRVDPEKIAVIYEAADERFSPVQDEKALEELRESFGLPGDFIFTAGSIHTRRNLERLIEAVALAGRNLGYTPALLILGTPAPFTPPVDIRGAAAKAGIKDRVYHVEYVSERELLLLYNACTMFAYPSLYEGFGLPVIEAMACGCPVACAKATSLPEVGGDAVLYFDPLEIESIAEAVFRIMSDEALRANLRRAGIERAKRFSWKRAAEETLKVFHEIA